MRIPLSAPDIHESDIEAVFRVLRSPQLSLGPKLEEFESSIASYIGAPDAVAVSSGTSGLHLCIRALGIGEGDEVLVPSFTFIAAARCDSFRGSAASVCRRRTANTQHRSRENRNGHHVEDARHHGGAHVRLSCRNVFDP